MSLARSSSQVEKAISAEKSDRQADKPFVISREIDAPSDLVCRLWTERVMQAMMKMEKLDIKDLQQAHDQK